MKKKFLKYLRVSFREPYSPEAWLCIANGRLLKHGARRSVESGYDIEYNKQNVYFSEALVIFKKALDIGIGHEEKCDVIPRMVKHYAIIGEYGKAMEVAENMDPVAICKEYLLTLAADDKDKYKLQKDAMIELIRQLKNVMYSMVWTNKAFYRNQNGIERLQETKAESP